MSSTQIGWVKISYSGVYQTRIGLAENCSAQVGPAQGCPAQIGLIQVRPAQINQEQVGPAQLLLAYLETAS